MIVHTGDIDNGIPSIHPDDPERKGELYVRQELLLQGLNLFQAKGLVDIQYDNGITYSATECASPFIESLDSIYTSELIKRAKWIVGRIKSKSHKDLKVAIETFINSESTKIYL